MKIEGVLFYFIIVYIKRSTSVMPSTLCKSCFLVLIRDFAFFVFERT